MGNNRKSCRNSHQAATTCTAAPYPTMNGHTMRSLVLPASSV